MKGKELLNKTIYYNDTMYKIVRTTKSYFYINALKIDNEHIISAVSFEYIDILPRIEEEKLRHYTDILTNDKQIKIKKTDLIDYLIIDNIKNICLVNNERTQDYYKNWKNSRWPINDIYLFIKYNVYLLTNEYIKNDKKEFRENKLFLILLH